MKSPISTLINDDETSNDKEPCPICLADLNKQDIGIPNSCKHTFCVDCINEWSKNVNTCPIDRKEFNQIQVKKYNGKFLRNIEVETKSSIENNETYDDVTFCEVCSQSNREDRLLLCDSCDNGYHLECLNPPLDEVPMGLWFCPVCAPTNNYRASNTLVSATIFLINPFSSESTNRQTNQIARTRFVQRVRNRVNYLRANSSVTRDDINRAQIRNVETQRRKRRIVRKKSLRKTKRRGRIKKKKPKKKVLNSTQKRIIEKINESNTNSTETANNPFNRQLSSVSTFGTNNKEFRLFSLDTESEIIESDNIKPCCSKSLERSDSKNLESENKSADIFNSILNKQRGFLSNWSKTNVKVKRDGSLIVNNSNMSSTKTKQDYDPFNPSDSDNDDSLKYTKSSSANKNYKNEDSKHHRRRSRTRSRSKDRRRRSRSRSYERKHTKYSSSSNAKSQKDKNSDDKSRIKSTNDTKKEPESTVNKIKIDETKRDELKEENKVSNSEIKIIKNSNIEKITESNKSLNDTLTNENDDYEPENDLVNNKSNNKPDESTKNNVKKSEGIKLNNNDKAKLLESIKEIAKTAIKPYYINEKITKDDYKIIMKKVVDKSMNYAKTAELKSEKVTKLVVDYVQKVKMEKKIQTTTKATAINQ